jgi:hypothetical protein
MPENHVHHDKQRHFYLQLINTPPSIKQIPPNNRQTKRWHYAQRRDNMLGQKRDNIIVEGQFRSILAEVKKLSANEHTPVFERDYRKDNTESALAMHAYLSSSFYFFLECDILCEYRIAYAFHNCPYELAIRKLLEHYLLASRAKEQMLKPDFNTFYLNVLRVQDKQYITY